MSNFFFFLVVVVVVVWCQILEFYDFVSPIPDFFILFLKFEGYCFCLCDFLSTSACNCISWTLLLSALFFKRANECNFLLSLCVG
jgi:hypothetical protein